MSHIFVNTPAAVTTMMDSLPLEWSTTPSLYLNVLVKHPGANLGSISLLGIHVHPQNATYIVDVLTLGAMAFLTEGQRAPPLRFLLQSDSVKKVLFDIYNASKALEKQFDIAVDGVTDVQVMETIYSTHQGPKRKDLMRCVEEYGVAREDLEACKAVEYMSQALVDPDRGGSQEAFDVRPLSEIMEKYCVQGATLLPGLWATLSGRLTDEQKGAVAAEVGKRLFDRSQKMLPAARPSTAKYGSASSRAAGDSGAALLQYDSDDDVG